MPTAKRWASSGEWEWVDPSTIVAVTELVRDVRRELESKAASSWGVEHRKTVEDMLARVTALMRELAHLAGYEDVDGDARHVEPLHRRLELLAADGRRLTDLLALPDAQRQSR